MSRLPYLLALGLTVAVEAPIVALSYPGQRLRLGAACCIATALTHAALFLVLFRFVTLDTCSLVLGELGATLFEALAYTAVSRGRWPRALMASSLANGSSFGLGLLLS